jgi:signal peptidase I
MQPEWAQEMRKHTHGDEIVVPPGKYFAMGDNRDRSLDSRYWGFVDRDAIMGRPFLIYWSIDAKSADYKGGSTFWSRLSGVFETLVHLPSRTRWSRMLHTVH